MLDSHLDIGSVDEEQWNALYAAMDHGTNDAVLQFLASGGDPNLRNRHQGWTLLHAAAFKDRRVLVEALIQRGADIDALRSGDHFTPLAQAAHKGHVGCLRVLLDAGASLEVEPLRMPLIESLQYAQVKSARVVDMLRAERELRKMVPRPPN